MDYHSGRQQGKASWKRQNLSLNLESGGNEMDRGKGAGQAKTDRHGRTT